MSRATSLSSPSTSTSTLERASEGMPTRLDLPVGWVQVRRRVEVGRSMLARGASLRLLRLLGREALRARRHLLVVRRAPLGEQEGGLRGRDERGLVEPVNVLARRADSPVGDERVGLVRELRDGLEDVRADVLTAVVWPAVLRPAHGAVDHDVGRVNLNGPAWIDIARSDRRLEFHPLALAGAGGGGLVLPLFLRAPLLV
mmetsp:Transcript_34770/g.79371  ORF Transcript_34770/g.79371 Transcript_34770/m.79371 type:complete len:200 (-) Transcript_34770:97-696(-)